MMIIHNEDQFKATETRMIADNNSIVKDDEINDLSLTSTKRFSTDEQIKPHEDFLKSSNKRKQIKPNRVANDNEQSLGIKQQEAYCKLCERSFCNKYFLKTHFAKKHGVININSPPSPCDQSSPVIADDKIGEDYCEICQKRFCNKYYLRKHKGECHGVYTDYIKSLQKSTNETPVKNQNSRISSFYVSSSPPPLNVETNQSSLSQQQTIRRCQYCPEQFRSRALLRVHHATHHPNEMTKKKVDSTPTTLPVSPTNKLGFLQSYVDTSSPLAHKLAAGQATQSSYGILHDSYFCAKMADRVVCEICNKQVCNKYFLKTHKAKVHGITNGNNDNLPPTMVPPVDSLTDDGNENSDNYCSLCQKDFPNKYVYLLHMRTIHNDSTEINYETLMEIMKAAAMINGNSFSSLPTGLLINGNENAETSDDESDGTIDQLKRKRSLSQSSNDRTKRFQTLTENNGGLQPFLLESEDPKFAHTFVPCMVYLPVVRRVTKQVKLNLKLKPVLTPDNAVAN